MKEKTFNLILSQFSQNPDRAKRALTDMRLTALEKLIVEGYLLLRDKKSAEIVTLLTKVSTTAPAFVEAHKNLLLGMAYSNVDDTVASEKCLVAAAKYFAQENFVYYEFVSLQNLFITYLNANLQEKMLKTLEQIREVAPGEPKNVVRALMCEFFYFSRVEDLKNAKSILNKIYSLSAHMTEATYPPLLVNVFAFHINSENFKEAENTLEELKKYRKYNIKETYNFNRILLGHYMHGDPIYFYEVAFENFQSLFHELKVIQKLDEGDVNEALTHWFKLQNMFPHQYQGEFKYKGGKSIFSLCLEKHLSKMQAKLNERTLKIAEQGDGNHMESLKQVFKDASGPILKDDLFEIIWGKKPESKADYIRLSNTVGRLRKKTGLDIKTRKGSYYIEQAKKKSIA